MADQVRLGSIGLGWWGGELARGAAAGGAARVTHCFARTAATREAFAARYGCEPAGSLEALLSADIDGVMIATPHSTHADLVIAAAGAGKAAMVDKPFTLTVADAERAIAAASEAGVVLQVGHNKRRQPAIRRIKQMIAEERLGDVHHYEALHSVPTKFRLDRPPWRWSAAENPAGGMAPLGVHQVDNFHYLGGQIVRVNAISKSLYGGDDMDDTTSVQFEFASGATGHLFTSQATGPTVELSVHGTDASAWSLGDGSLLRFQKRGEPPPSDESIEDFDTVADEVAEFAAAIRGEKTPETGGAEGRAVVAVYEAIVASAETGMPVAVA